MLSLWSHFHTTNRQILVFLHGLQRQRAILLSHRNCDKRRLIHINTLRLIYIVLHTNFYTKTEIRYPPCKDVILSPVRRVYRPHSAVHP